MQLKITYDNGETIDVPLPDTHTMTLRGGDKYELDRTQYHAEGIRKIFTYGEGRYLRDGAPAVAVIDAPTGKDLATLRGVKGQARDKDTGKYHVSASGISELFRAGASALVEACNASLNTAARTHADSRVKALHTGEISQGRISSIAPEVPILRAIVAKAYVKATGCKISKVPKLPGTVEGIRSAFLAIPGLSPPKGQGNTGKWFTAILAHAREEAQRRASATEGLGI